jgi:hypothetical protein
MAGAAAPAIISKPEAPTMRRSPRPRPQQAPPRERNTKVDDGAGDDTDGGNDGGAVTGQGAPGATNCGTSAKNRTGSRVHRARREAAQGRG